MSKNFDLHVSPTTSRARRYNANSDTEDQRPKPYNIPSSADGDGCVSCRISIPHDISSKLPAGAPGSPRKDGKGRNGSPVLRSREAVHACISQPSDLDEDEDGQFQQSSPESCPSDMSASSCHTHTVTYVTTSSPVDPHTYSLLRRASIRTLSCEQLPRGLTSGPLIFGDPVAGYTIAHKFRLPDPNARGRQRYYALLALAGQDAGRAFKTSLLILRVFERIAAAIMASAENAISQERVPETGIGERSGFTPVSSFLTGRTMDPDGYPRRNGTTKVRAKGLAEMVGNDLVFAELHADFVALLQALGRHFGGMRVEVQRMGSSLHHESHADISARSVEDGKHVESERPLVTDPNHAPQTIDRSLAKLYGGVTMPHMQQVVA